MEPKQSTKGTPGPRLLLVAVEQRRGGCVGTALRSAVAFGAAAVVLVGARQHSTHGAHGAQKHIPILHFFHWDDFREFVKSVNSDCELCCLHTVSGSAGSHSQGKWNESMDVLEHHLQTKSNQIDMNWVDDYEFCHSGVVIILPHKKTGLFSREQYEVAETHLQVRFPCLEKISDMVHPDVKLTICLQQFAVQHMKMEQKKIDEEKFIIENDSLKLDDIATSYDKYKKDKNKAGAIEECCDVNLLFGDY